MSQGAPPPFMEDDDDREPLVNPNRVPHGGQPAQGKQGLTEAEARAAERQRVQAKQKGPQGSQQAHPQHHPPHDRPQSGRGRGGAAPQGGPTHSKNAPHPQHTAPAAPPSGTTASTPSKPVVLPQEDRVLIPYVAGSRPNIEDGMKKGTIIVGALRTMAWSTGIAWVTCPGLGVDVEVHTVEARGSALPGDIVAVELTEDRTLWTDRPLKGGDEAGEEDMITASHTCFSKRNVDGPKATLPDGREVMYVVDDHAHTSGKIARSHPVLDVYATVGTQPPVDQIPDTKKPRGVVVAVMVRRFTMLHPSRLIPGNDGAARVVPNRYYRFRSYDKSFPYIAVYGRDIPQEMHGELEDVLPLIRIMPDASGAPEFVDRRFPRGRVIMSLGKGGSAEAETRAIAASNNIKDAPFTDEVLASVMPEFVIPSPQMLQEMERRDLRQEEFVCTIDPATARDLDDALSITKTSGGYRVGVHIADVSFFVPLDSEVDLEARSRATSTYFVERVIPMLPHKLCEDYCSLNAGEDKFAFSCIFQMDNDCKITSEWFGQSVIRNRCRMAYEDAQRIIDGDTSGDSLVFHAEELKLGVSRADLIKKVVSSVQMLFKVAQHMRARRFEDGSLTLNKNKLKFKFDDINARVAPIGFELDAIHESNWMVEQFMLLANIRVAEKVVEFMPQCALVRKHPTPDRKKLKAFAKAAADHGLKVSIRSSKGLNDSLNGYKDDPRSDALRLMATYCMMLAKYVSSGDDESESIAHFALATPCYTHFTSPIRRYADLTIHRQLLLALEIESHVKRNTVKGTPDAPVDISKLHYSNYYFTHYEVDEVATRCNEQKERARKCSDASMKMFFCLYLEAIRLRAQVDATVVPFQRVSVDVVRVKDGYFTVYAAEIGTDCEIAMNAHNQHWTGECHYDSKDNIFKINWGGEGEGEENEETVGLFHRFTALLAVKHDQGMMKLDMIIDRPEHRDVAVGVRRLL